MVKTVVEKIVEKVKNSLLLKLSPYYKKYGKKALFVMILFYIVRDVTLYVLIPFFAVSNLK